MVVVGKEYVMGLADDDGLRPILGNSQYSPAHPHRVVVLSVGPKFAKAMMSGYSKPTKVLVEHLWEIDTAKALYRQALEAREAEWAAKGHKGLGRLLEDWFTVMALKYCGKDYGSTKRNRYFFYRTVYHMTATEAWSHVNGG